MEEVVALTVEGEIGIVTVDSPPVNALGVNVRAGLDRCFKQADANDAIRAVVLICSGRTFFAGADISELGKPLQPPSLRDVFDIIENGRKPIVAAIHGSALGGGLELALICHYRIAVPSAKLGLPEVNLGLLPGAGGTQRLPRIVGAEAALDILVGGKPVPAARALELGMIDALAEAKSLRDGAVAFARDVLSQGKPLLRVRDRTDRTEQDRANPGLFDAYRTKNARAFRGFKAPANIVKAVEAAVSLPFEDGLLRERELYQELLAGTESAAQRYAFFAERGSAKVPDIAADTTKLPIRTVGVVGAGTMGGGIAMNFLNAGIPVTLVEMSQEAIDRGLTTIRRNYDISAKKGRMTADEVETRMALITPSLALEDLAQADLIVEAIFESMDVKKDMFAKLDAIARPGAILASNTSFLDLDQIAAATGRPDSVVGLHFFSPANVMRLLEVVRGAKTSDTVIATAMALAKTIGKVPVLARVCDGFIANRLMRPRTRQAEALVLEGPSAGAIDKALIDYGFAMGQFQMMDLVGLDVIGHGSSERTLRTDMVARGRRGQKQGGGFYDYDADRRATPSTEASEIVAAFAAYKGVEQRPDQDSAEILARLLYPVVNEGAKILEEGVAIRASDIDVAAMLGYNWPVYTGGPMFWADTVGLPKILAGLRELETRLGDDFRPAPLLERLVAEGKSFVHRQVISHTPSG